MQRRTAAATAFIKADSTERLRRAFLRKRRDTHEAASVGDECYFWRDRGASRIQKSRWRGPATVALREDAENGQPK
eukprot:1228104-Pyramimonas_sp.AAC.1